jgi:hypothetical protein
VKGTIAYTGTMAMGLAAIKYFEQGADLTGVLKALTERAGETAAWAASRVRRPKGVIEMEFDEELLAIGPGDMPDPAPARVPHPAPARPSAGYTTAGTAPVEPEQPALMVVPRVEPTMSAPPAETPPSVVRPLDDDGVGAGTLP